MLKCAIDVFTKCTCVKSLTDKKAETVLDGYIRIVNKSKRKQNKLWVDKGRELYNNLMQKWLDDSNVPGLSYNESNPMVLERFIRTLKSKIYKNMTANDTKSYLNYLNKLVDEYNNTYHPSIGKKPIDADYSALTAEIEMNPKTPKFKISDSLRITTYKNFF